MYIDTIVCTYLKTQNGDRLPSVYLMLFYAPDHSTWFMSLWHYFLHKCIYKYVLYRSKKGGGGVSVYWINDH